MWDILHGLCEKAKQICYMCLQVFDTDMFAKCSLQTTLHTYLTCWAFPISKFVCAINITISVASHCTVSGVCITPTRTSSSSTVTRKLTSISKHYSTIIIGKCYAINLQLYQNSKTFQSLLSINVVSSYCLIESVVLGTPS